MKRSSNERRATGVRIFAPNGLAAAMALALAGCGGGGGDGGSVDAGAPADKPTAFSGVVATGAPLAGATLTVTDANGAAVCSTTVAANGEYLCTLKAGAAAPFAFKASTAEHALYSSAATAEGGTINVTPLTTLIVSKLSPTGNPADFAAQMQADPGLASPARIEALVEELRRLIAPLQAAAGASAIDPLRGRFKADGTGHDKVLDSLQVSIRPEAEAANIEVTMKVVPASDTAAPVAVAFRSTEDVPPAPAQITGLKPEALATDGIALLVADFVARMNDCYALPLAQRISGVAADAASATGGASAVQAPQCRSLFVDDDPARYKDNGATVGSGGHFYGMYYEIATGARFDLANFEYLWANGDAFVTFRSTTAGGAVGYQSVTLRRQGGKLKAIGNQYDYAASVRPIMSNRHWPLQPAFDYLTTGYNVQIANKVDAGGNPLFKEAIVTTPDGRQITYRPRVGRSNMLIVRGNGELSYANVQQLAAAYVDPRTAGNPADRDETPMFAPTQLTDDQIRKLPDQGVWTIEWVHRDAAKANVQQNYRTIERAPTLGEVRQTAFAQFSPKLEAEWLARDDVQTHARLIFGNPSATEPNVLNVKTATGGNGWLVPDGAIAPTWVGAYSYVQGESYNDGTDVTIEDRTATVRCSTQSAGDNHCDSSTGTLQYVAGNSVNTLELWGRTIRQVERSTLLSFIKLPD